MKTELYNAIFRLFDEGNGGLFITVGQLKLGLYDNGKEHASIWDFGITVNGEPYTVGYLYHKGLGPGTYGELFRGDYDIIDGLTEWIYQEELEQFA